MKFDSVIMNFFSLFPTIFVITAFTCLLLLCIFFFLTSGFRRPPKPVCYISYKKNHFHEEFEFACEFCGSTVSLKDEKCSKGNSAFGKNKGYGGIQ